MSFAITPSQLHGASSRTLSNFISNLLACKPSILKMEVLYTPQRIILNDIDRALLPLGSNAIMEPLLFIFWAINVVLPPGAAEHPIQPDLLQHLVRPLPGRSR